MKKLALAGLVIWGAVTAYQVYQNVQNSGGASTASILDADLLTPFNIIVSTGLIALYYFG